MAHQRLLGYGSALVDVIVHVDEPTLQAIPGEKGGTRQVTPEDMGHLLDTLPTPQCVTAGGASANAVATAGHLRQDAAFLANLGDDANGNTFLKALERAEVDVTRCRRHRNHITGTCLTLVTPDAERTMRSYLGDETAVPPEIFTPEDFRGFTHFLLEGYAFRTPDMAMHLLELAHDAKLTVCLDFNAQEVVAQYRELLRDILPRYVTLVMANELEARAFAQTDSEPEALRKLSELCPLAVVKQGIRGCLIQSRGQPQQHVSAFPVRALDTTGAGDCWAGGFCTAWLQGKSPAEAAEFGARVAAEVVQVDGTQMPESTWQKLRNFL